MKVEKIVVKDKYVHVELDDGDMFAISLETYLNNKILLNDEISEDEINDLIKKSRVDSLRLELLKKLNKKRYSCSECYSYLEMFNLENEDIEKIIEEFKRIKLIDDEELINTLVTNSLVNKKGINLILKKVESRGIEITIEDLRKYIDNDKYFDNINYLIDRYKKLSANKSNSKRRQYIINKLLENGYQLEEINKIKFDLDNNEEVIIRKEVHDFFQKYDYTYENITKITRKLLSKGFNYDIIKLVVRECEESETN